MSQQNVQIVREVFEAYSRGVPPADRPDLIAPDIVWNPAEEAESHGVEGVSAYMERWENEWDELETSAEEFIDAGDRVVVTVYFRGRGKASGIEVDARFWEVYTLRDGRITRMDEFTERAEALAAAGIAE
jgi:ketosteroid isomerase-like protein